MQYFKKVMKSFLVIVLVISVLTVNTVNCNAASEKPTNVKFTGFGTYTVTWKKAKNVKGYDVKVKYFTNSYSETHYYATTKTKYSIGAGACSVEIYVRSYKLDSAGFKSDVSDWVKANYSMW